MYLLSIIMVSCWIPAINHGGSIQKSSFHIAYSRGVQKPKPKTLSFLISYKKLRHSEQDSFIEILI